MNLPSPQMSIPSLEALTEKGTYRITVAGLVQGVGFRPFVYQLAHALGLKGWVMNTGQGVFIEISADEAKAIREFLIGLSEKAPVGSRYDAISYEKVPQGIYDTFEIRESKASPINTDMPLDMAPCAHCLSELRDQNHRLYGYPFISCVSCGPRYTITASLPFDRDHTAMADFPLCSACKEEYEHPKYRRFHAQTLSCFDCGPTLIWSTDGGAIKYASAALEEALSLLRLGAVVAIKGVGGYQLAALATHDDAVRAIRHRKVRPKKPLAVMFENIEAIRPYAEFNELEKAALQSQVAPIVLLARRLGANPKLADSLSFDVPLVGAMLPSSPLHVLLLDALQAPLVMTSANRQGEPMIIDDGDWRLKELSDGVLSHNRPIYRRNDDTVLRCIGGKMQAMRCGRGVAPYTLNGPFSDGTRLALGGMQKVAMAWHQGTKVTVSPHIGSLTGYETHLHATQVIDSLIDQYQKPPDQMIHDAHPDYPSTHMAKDYGAITRAVFHHRAHIGASLSEHPIQETALALSWDGAGFGEDGMIWGGECFLVEPHQKTCTRVAHVLPFPLLGGEAAIREPRRIALAMAWLLYPGPQEIPDTFLRQFSDIERSWLPLLLAQSQEQPYTTSMARLFDGVASILNLKQINGFEGEGAMHLEAACDINQRFEPYPFPLVPFGQGFHLDWRPMLRRIISEHRQAVAHSVIATRFHQALVAAIEALMSVLQARSLRIGGGVFQNRFLVDLLVARLSHFDLKVPEKVPCNDGGLAVGQLYYHCWQKEHGPCV